eukprot:8592962-Pyramimonas_sp.AAC.1
MGGLGRHTMMESCVQRLMQTIVLPSCRCFNCLCGLCVKINAQSVKITIVEIRRDTDVPGRSVDVPGRRTFPVDRGGWMRMSDP